MMKSAAVSSQDAFADDDVVITGISGRFPLADSIDELKDNLFSKRNCVIPAEERWSADLPGCPDNHIGVMKTLDKFDSEFFGMSFEAANDEDPQNRILLEVSYEAIVDAGYNPRELRGKKIGVFAGESDADPIALERNIKGCSAYKNPIAYVACLAANRLSQFYGFKGPSFAIDTACSSSGVALEDAFRRLKAGTIEAAVVVGTSLCLDPRCSNSYVTVGILSTTGFSCSFDARANGLVKGEAIAAIFIQKKKDARRIYAKIHNMECTSAGYVPEGIFVPTVRAETHLFRKTYEAIGMDPTVIEYIEGHGTSTPVGDPTEVNSIDEVFCKNRTTPLLLGGIKSNIGHTEASSAICSIAKVIFAFEMGLIPPNINFETPNPNSPALSNGKIKVITETTPFDNPLAALNNFGFGGVGIHMIMERNWNEKNTEDQEVADKIPKLVVYSATTGKALTDMFNHFHKKPKPTEFYALLNKSAYISTQAARFRGFTIIHKDSPPVTCINRCSSTKRQVWYVFSGMGCQWPGMGLDLMELEVFAQSMKKSAKILQKFGIDLFELLNPNKDCLQQDRHITPAFVTIAAIQIALVDVLNALGLTPDGILGHSTGEIVCSYADGCSTAEQTILSAYHRGASVECTDLPPGAMAAVGLSWEEAQKRCPGGVYPACNNAEDSVTVSGEKEAVERFVKQLKSEGIFARTVNAYGYAFHCKTISAVTGTLRKNLQNVYPNPKPRSKRWLSSSFCEEEWNDPRCQLADAEYYCHNLESQVHFKEVLPHIPSNTIIIEIGPNFLLEPILKRSVGSKASYISLMKRNENNVDFFLSSIGKLYNLGLDPQVENLYPSVSYPVPRGTPMIASLIQWDHSNSFYVPKYSELIVGKGKMTVKTTSTEKFLLDYCIEGRSLYPAAGYIYLVWKALSISLQKPLETLPIYIEDFKIMRTTVLSPIDDTSFEVGILNMRGDFEIVERGAIVATGKIFVPTRAMFGEIKPSSQMNQSSLTVCGTEIYQELKIHGYEYGPAFRGLLRTNLEGTDGLVKWENEWIPFLDSLLLFFGIICEKSEIKLPTSALSLKIDPQVHQDFVADMEKHGLKGVPVKYEQYVRKCSTPGVEIRNLKLDPAPRRSLAEIVPVAEEYSFEPYEEKLVYESEEKANCESYIQVCCHLARQIVDRLKIKGHIQNIVQDVKLDKNIDIEEYLSASNENYKLLKLMLKILKIPVSSNLTSQTETECKNISEMLAQDFLFEAILNEKPMRSLLDVAAENCLGTMTLAEWYDGNSMMLPKIQEIMKPFMESKTRYIVVHSRTTTVDVEHFSQKNILVERAADNDSIPKNCTGFAHVGVTSFLLGTSDCLKSQIRKVVTIAKEGGFIVVVHKHKLTPPELFMHSLSKLPLGRMQSEANIETVFSKENLVVVSKKSSSLGINVYLLRKAPPEIQLSRIHIVRVLDGGYNRWVGELKEAMVTVQDRNSSDAVFLVAQDTPTNGLIGMANCLRKEPGGNKIRCVFTDRSAPHFDLKNSFYADILEKNIFMNVYMNGIWGSYRYTSLSVSRPQEFVPYASIDCTKVGDMTSFKWIESPSTHVQSQETTDELYHVYYSSLNFRDIMLVTGKLPASIFKENGYTNGKPLIGIEFSGRDKNGRRIMGMSNGGCLGNTVIGKPLIVYVVPDNWTLEEAATVPVVYSVCYFALIIKGKLEKGEKVLIHCGTGGIGQAAIRIALSLDCEIFATVGTPEKKDFLLKTFPRLKPENIGCSRDTSFEEMIIRKTNKTGVDVILNSLTEDKFQATIRCVAKHGRFLEIGKYDMAQNNLLGLRVFLKDVVFHSIQLDTFRNGNQKSAQVIKRIKELVEEGIHSGVVQPLNKTIFPVDDVEKAFRYMANGQHIGKVLLKIREEEKEKITVPAPMKVKAHKSFSLSKNKSYIIIGGLGNFGIELAKWLVQKGAGSVVLTSRSGARTPYHHLCLKRWQDSGDRVVVSTLNVAKRDEAKKLLQETAKKYGPIGGIFNAAKVLHDAFVENQTVTSFEEVCSPKALATKNVDELTRTMCPELDLFVCFSSISCGKGIAGQANYGYGNSVMERICEQRKQDGLHGLAVQWGIIGDLGLVHWHTGTGTMIAGIMPQKIKSCLQCLEKFLLRDEAIISSFVSAYSWKPAKKPGDIFSEITKIFNFLDLDQMDPSLSFGAMETDSLVCVQLKQLLDSSFDMEFTLQEVRGMKIHDVKKLAEEWNQSKSLHGPLGKEIKSIDFNGPEMLFPTEAVSPLNSAKTGTPLFIVHGNDLLQQKLKGLCEGISRPVFALQSTADTPINSINDMVSWYLKQIQKATPGTPVDLASISTAASLALEMTLQSENKKWRQPVVIRNLSILDGSLELMETYTTTDQEKEKHESKYEAADICEFLSPFSASDLTQLKIQLELLPSLESRITMASNLLGSVDKSSFLEAIEFYVKKQNLLRCQPTSKKLEKDLIAIEASEKLLPNDLSVVKSFIEEICNGRVTVHRIKGKYEFLTSTSSAMEVAKLLDKA